jgi:hypothetical protein
VLPMRGRIGMSRHVNELRTAVRLNQKMFSRFQTPSTTKKMEERAIVTLVHVVPMNRMWYRVSVCAMFFSNNGHGRRFRRSRLTSDSTQCERAWGTAKLFDAREPFKAMLKGNNRPIRAKAQNGVAMHKVLSAHKTCCIRLTRLRVAVLLAVSIVPSTRR